MSNKKWHKESIFDPRVSKLPSASKRSYSQPPNGHTTHQNESYATASFYGSQAKQDDILHLGGPLFSEENE